MESMTEATGFESHTVSCYRMTVWSDAVTVTIRKQSVDRLARQLAAMRGVTITRAVEGALEAAVIAETRNETAGEVAERILARRGIFIQPGGKPVPQSAYHDLDHDLIGEDG